MIELIKITANPHINIGSRQTNLVSHPVLHSFFSILLFCIVYFTNRASFPRAPSHCRTSHNRAPTSWASHGLLVAFLRSGKIRELDFLEQNWSVYSIWLRNGILTIILFLKRISLRIKENC